MAASRGQVAVILNIFAEDKTICMKKLFMTFSAVALMGFAANAQDKKSDVKVNDKPNVTADKPVAPAATDHAADEPKKDDGKRMAITQKGLPASKKVEPKDKPAATEPKTPAKTEKP
jgi:hypothetical protein